MAAFWSKIFGIFELENRYRASGDDKKDARIRIKTQKEKRTQR